MKLFYATARDESDTMHFLIKNCRTVTGAEKKLRKWLRKEFGRDWLRDAFVYVDEVYLNNDVNQL